jgi:hypothetical protein
MKKTMMELASEYMNNQEYNSLLEIFLLDYNNKSISLQQKKRVVQYINSNIDILKEEKNIPNNDLLNDVLNAATNSESYLPISKAGKIAGFLKSKADNVIMSNDKYFDFASQLENDFSVISSFDAEFDVKQFKDTLIEKMQDIKMEEEEKIYLNVKFEDKNKVKEKGAKWDVDKKKWYIYNSNPNKTMLIETYK